MDSKTPQEAVELVKDQQPKDESTIDKPSPESERALLLLKELEEIISMRRRWSNWLLVFVGLITISDLAFLWLLSSGVVTLDTDTIPLFIGESVIKVIGLAFLVVKFLFSKDSVNHS